MPTCTLNIVDEFCEDCWNLNEKVKWLIIRQNINYLPCKPVLYYYISDILPRGLVLCDGGSCFLHKFKGLNWCRMSMPLPTMLTARPNLSFRFHRINSTKWFYLYSSWYISSCIGCIDFRWHFTPWPSIVKRTTVACNYFQEDSGVQVSWIYLPAISIDKQ